MKYVSPYYIDNITLTRAPNVAVAYIRKPLYAEFYLNSASYYGVWLGKFDHLWHPITWRFGKLEEFNSKKDAMRYLDDYLLSIGYEFLDKEQ